jgi:hypothetical protein
VTDIPAGWYPDPEDPERTRWWDGQGWTARTDAPEPASPPKAGRSWRIPALVTAGFLVVALTGVGVVFALRGGSEPVEDQLVAAGTDVGTGAEDEPADEPEEAVESAPVQPETTVDIRDIDWAELSWTTTCGAENGSNSLRLAPVAGEVEGGGDHGYLGPDDGFMAHAYAVGIGDVVYGDVTGDGEDEAVFVAHCVPGNFVIQTVEVWRLVDGELHQLPPASLHDRTTGFVDAVETVDGALRLTTSEPIPGSETPWVREDGYPVTVVTDHRWGSADWVATELSRDVEESAGCTARPGSPEEAARCLLEALVAGDRDAAARAGSAEAIRELHGSYVDEILHEWEFGGCAPADGYGFGLHAAEPLTAEWTCGWSGHAEEEGWAWSYGVILGINAYGDAEYRVDWVDWWDT